jgi:hypothetical protein
VYAATLVMLVLALAITVMAAESAKMSLKVGDEVFVCNCGDGCPCNSMAMKESKCSCGNAMLKGKVVKLGEGTAVIQVNGREQTFNTAGKYACACGEGCNCVAISQTPANCACGKPMKQVKANQIPACNPH